MYEVLLQVEIHATGTLCTNRNGVPASIVQLETKVVEEDDTGNRGTGYYIRGTGYYIHKSSTVYICLRDVNVVTIRVTWKLGVSEKLEPIDIPRLIAIERYNHYMGEVDNHNDLRKTIRHWKTLFLPHGIDIAAVNVFITYNMLAHPAGF